MTTLTPKIALEVATHEGLIRQAYLDSVGVWTWCVGITSASGHDVERYIDNPQPIKHCLEVWVWLLRKYNDDVTAAFTQPLTEEQRAAALSFHWNTGAIKRASWVKSFNNGEYNKAYKQFMNWKKPREIIPRREAERDLFFNRVWSQDGKMTEYTRVTSKHTPVWGSAVRIDVTKELTELLGPSMSGPVYIETPQTGNWFASLVSAVLNLFTGGKA